MSEPPPPLYYEREVASILGLSRSELSYLRKEHLKKSAGWTMAGRDVALTQPGLDILLERVRASMNAATGEINFAAALVPGSEPIDPAEKKEEPADPAAPQTEPA